MAKNWKPKIKESLSENAAAAVPFLFDDFYNRRIGIFKNLGQLERFHKMRIAGKPLRYAMETFETAFGRAFRKCLEEVKGLLEKMGAVHDSEVVRAFLDNFLDELAIFNRQVGKPDELPAKPILLLRRKAIAERDQSLADVRKTLAKWKRQGFRKKLIYVLREDG